MATPEPGYTGGLTAGRDWLSALAQQMRDDVENGASPRQERITVAELLLKFGYHMRTAGIVSHIRNRLDELGLKTSPDFEFAYRHGTISIELDSHDPQAARDPDAADPTHRIGSLKAAHQPPLSVHPDRALNAATTIMHLHDVFQVPVMENTRKVNGIISWQSIGTRTALGRDCSLVRHCMEPHVEVSIDTPLFQAINTIAEEGYVLVRDKTQVVTGIVTASDLSLQFVQMAGPFLIIGEIEGHLRHLIRGKFTVAELRGDTDDAEGDRNIAGAADLTLGNYCRLLENPDRWNRLNLNVDRAEFIKHLNDVRNIRNDVMHFDPDGLLPEDTQKLRDVARFFRDLVHIGAV